MPARSNGWNDYEKLVLAELERLDAACEKLRELSLQIDRGHHTKNDELRTELSKEISNSEREFKEEIGEIKKEIAEIRTALQEFKDEVHDDGKTSGHWGFWSAVVGIAGAIIISIGSAIASIVKFFSSD